MSTGAGIAIAGQAVGFGISVAAIVAFAPDYWPLLFMWAFIGYDSSSED